MSLSATPLGSGIRVVLIGGTSHVGKSTLARHWGTALGWPVVSTDKLGRHPGRPWPMEGRAVPPHVVEHYLTKADDELIEANLIHYRNMWPLVAGLIEAHATAPQGRLILEGSGCWPELVLALDRPEVGAVWLTASPQTLASRIRGSSGYAAADNRDRRLIDRFERRGQLYNERLLQCLWAADLSPVEVDDTPSPAQLVERCRSRLHALA